jgi:hypothetical protein
LSPTTPVEQGPIGSSGAWLTDAGPRAIANLDLRFCALAPTSAHPLTARPSVGRVRIGAVISPPTCRSDLTRARAGRRL